MTNAQLTWVAHRACGSD